MLIRSGQ